MTRFLPSLALGLLLMFSALAPRPAVAGGKDPLFINIVTSDPHGAVMALRFGKTMQERGHPLTLFFNNEGVLLVSKAHETTYPEQQKEIAGIAAAGATVLACGHCLGYYGVKEEAIVSGVKVGTPDSVSQKLFEANTKTLTW